MCFVVVSFSTGVLDCQAQGFGYLESDMSG